MNFLRIKGISRKYIRLAAAYRRYAGPNTDFDFSQAMLIECYNHETHGAKASKNNGYVFGKWCKDLSVVQWIEDIRSGSACKAEFYEPKDKWWSEPALEKIVVPCAWFPFSNELDIFGQRYNQVVRDRMS